MSYNTKDYFVEASADNIDSNTEVMHCDGSYDSIGTSYTPITSSGTYQTPQEGSQTVLRIKSGGNVNDTSNGTGARKILLIGLDKNFDVIEDVLITAGASNSAPTSKSFLRLFRVEVLESGTYATASTGSHSGNIIIESSGGVIWGGIISSGFARGRAQIAAYTVPRGKTAYILDLSITTEVNKTTDSLFFSREGANKSSAPYDAMTMEIELINKRETKEYKPKSPLGPFKEYTDIGFMAKVSSGTASVSASFEVLLRDKE